MDLKAGTPIDRWTDPVLDRSHGWIDARGRSPVTLYREYLRRRGEWEGRAWKFGGARDPRFTHALDELATLHAELSVLDPSKTRDASVVRPPSRDHRKVRVVAVDRSGHSVTITTVEDEFPGLLPTTFVVTVALVDDQWRLKDRIADHGPGRRLHLL